MKLRICHLYPDLLNLYGDRGNVLTLKRRCEWRNIGCTVEHLSIGQPFESKSYDLVFLGGGQDYEQNILQRDLIDNKGPVIREAVDAGLVFLCICGGFQLMGRYYEEQNGHRIKCLEALDLWTIARPERLIGNTVSRSDELAGQGLDPLLVGFENHAGRTWLGPSVRPMAMIERGGGNNGQDKTEGAIYKNVYCTYSHGSFLPKNPDMADHLIGKALQRRYGMPAELLKLDNILANNARSVILTCN